MKGSFSYFDPMEWVIKMLRGEMLMRCGAKCFLVELEVKGEKQTQSINARTPAEARKSIRLEYEGEARILSVVEQKRK